MIELLNVGLRALTLGSKFLLLFFLARVLPPADLGLYGLVAASIGYGIMILGLDFYTYANRELLSHDSSQWPAIIRDQAMLYGIVYAAGIPFFLLVFLFGVLPWSVAGWFFALLVIEHLAQELNRLLVAVGRPLSASMVLFVRSGLWVWVVVGLMWADPESRRIELVFSAWAAAAAGAVILGVAALRDLPWRERTRRVDWRWVRRGVGIAGTFLAATLSLKGVFTFDRYLAKVVAGEELLGVYTFYVTSALAIIAFLDAGVFAFLYPRVVAAYRAREYHAFRQHMRRLWHHTVIATGGLLACAAVAVKPVLLLLDRPIYGEYLVVFWLLLGAVALYALGMVPHYGLYAFGRDRVIVASHALGLVAFLAVAVPAGPVWGIAGIAAGLIAGLAVILLIKLWRYLYWFSWLASGEERITRSEVAS